MKKSFVIIIVVLGQFCLLFGQNGYKQNFLNLFNKIPEIKSCEAGYNFFVCKNNSCNEFKAAKASMDEASKDITAVQLTTGNAMTSSAQPVTSMTKEQADDMSKKLDKMTDAEKQQWAMQNAQAMMNPGAAHANQDVDNTAVNDAVACATKQQQEDMKDAMKPNDLSAQLKKIEDKYQSQKNIVLKTLQDATGDKNLTLENWHTGGGIATDAEIAKEEKAMNDFRKNIIPVYNAELSEKLAYLKTLNQNLVAKYTTLEEKVAATHYGDDAEENVNKTHLYMAHQVVLNKVMENFGNFEDVLLQYANKYADLQKMSQAKGFEEK